MASVQLNAVGVAIIGTVKEDGVAVDVSSAFVRQLILKKPDGSVITRVASLSSGGTDGRIQYVTASGDLNLAGQWSVQAYLQFISGFDGRSSIEYFTVIPNLS